MRIIKALVAVVLVGALAGCSSGAKQPEKPQAGGVTSSSETSIAASASAAVTTPVVTQNANEGQPIENLTAKGSGAERDALLEAAHASAGISDKTFYVWQLYRQGDSAVGDLQGSKSAKRKLVVLERSDGQWRVIGSTKYLDATEAWLKGTSPAITAAMVGEVGFVVPVEVDAFYRRVAPTVREMSGGSARVWAPTRLPEGFKLAHTEDGGAASAEYVSGDRRITYFAWISGDYGEGETPEAAFTSLRFGPMSATMDGSFPYRTDSDQEGPFLTAKSWNQVVTGVGVTPGMVAAVAESMAEVH